MNQYTKAIDEGIKSFTERYDLDNDVLAELRRLLLDSGKKHIKTQSAAAAAGTASGTSKAAGSGHLRRKTGYNMYIKSQFERANAQAGDGDGETADKTNSQDLMSRFSKEWTKLTAEEKQPYLDMAKDVNTANGTAPAVDKDAGKDKKNTKKKISGYNLFYMQNKDSIKAGLAEGQRLMKEVGAQWGCLSDEEKQDWTRRAKEYGAEAEADTEVEA